MYTILVLSPLQEEARRQRQLEHAELVSMRVEERRQCAHQDRFWGLDFLAYEQEREAWEVSTMRLLLM